MSAELRAMSEAHLTGSGETVTGPFKPEGGGPSHMQVADAHGASYFSLGDEWSKFSPPEQFPANQHALDVAIANRDVITLSVPFDTIPKDTYTAAEIRYFEAHGYTLKGGFTLVPPPDGKPQMKKLLAFFYNHFEFLYLNPLYRIADSSTTGSVTDRASLTLMSQTMTITLTNDHEVIRCSVSPTKFPGQRNWFWMSLLCQFLDGGEETIVSPAENAAWLRDNFSRIEALFTDDVVLRSIEEISTLRRENAVKEFGRPT